MYKHIRTHVVGLQFANISDTIVLELQKNTPLHLTHLPDNPYDRNAIGVYVGKSRVGYIRQKHSKTFVQALTNSAWVVSVSSDEPTSITKDSKSFPVTIRIETRHPSLGAAPKIYPDNAGGIYRLHLVKIGAAYIGLANHVNSRISDHWHDMALGTHANYKLQQYWINHGPTQINVQLLESLPSSLTPQQRQEWLGQHEVEWIERERASGICINLQNGRVVMLAADRCSQQSAQEEQGLQSGQEDRLLEGLIEAQRQKAVERHRKAKIEAEDAMFLKQLEEALDIRHGIGPGSFHHTQTKLLEEYQQLETDLEFLSEWEVTLTKRVADLDGRLSATKGLRGLLGKRLQPQQITDLISKLGTARQDLARAVQEREEKTTRLILLKQKLDALNGQDETR